MKISKPTRFPVALAFAENQPIASPGRARSAYAADWHRGDTFHSSLTDAFDRSHQDQPARYAGAVIGGTITSVDRSRRLSGRSLMSLSFETIRPVNGKTYRFEVQ